MRPSRVLLTAVVVLLGCGGGDPPTVPIGGNGGDGSGGGSTSNAITVSSNFYSPNLTTVPAGTTVTWTWAGGTHDVTFDTGNLKSPTQSSGTYERRFTTAGTYDYHCSVHGAAMSGRVVVQ